MDLNVVAKTIKSLKKILGQFLILSLYILYLKKVVRKYHFMIVFYGYIENHPQT